LSIKALRAILSRTSLQWLLQYKYQGAVLIIAVHWLTLSQMTKNQSMKPTGKKRIRNPKQTRAKLLQATIGLVADNGAETLSLKEAARVANVSRGVAYQHFEDRDHLLREAKTWIAGQLLESVKEVHSFSMEESVNHVARLVLNNREATRLLVADARCC